jgi:3-deoxy-manno-octulosonate cytidylyltransferase (CMP-KDO synthetase)
MKILGIIPARFGSTRFPGKPLAEIHGKSMIQRVYEQCKKSIHLSDILVATDDVRIIDHVKGFGGNVYMTAKEHRSGTERCKEALEIWEKYQAEKWEYVINIQGDEPFISPDDIDLVGKLLGQEGAEIATLVKRITNEDELSDPNIVKVVLDQMGDALYFSRSMIPFAHTENTGDWLAKYHYFKHIGIYGYTSTILKRLSGLPETDPERAESLEQLRWLGHGLKIATAITDNDSISIDSPSDLLKITNIT